MISIKKRVRILSEALGNVPGGGGAGDSGKGIFTADEMPFMYTCDPVVAENPLVSPVELGLDLTHQQSGSDHDADEQQPALRRVEYWRDPSSQCWGAQISLDDARCVPGYTRGSKHQKNKFCDACRNCISIPASRVVTISEEQHSQFLNSWAGGVWAKNSWGWGYRVVNHTALCSGPRLLIFQADEVPTNLEFPPMPEHWVHDGMVNFFVSKGTLVPIASGSGSQQPPPGSGDASQPCIKKRRRLADEPRQGKPPVTKVEPVMAMKAMPELMPMPTNGMMSMPPTEMPAAAGGLPNVNPTFGLPLWNQSCLPQLVNAQPSAVATAPPPPLPSPGGVQGSRVIAKCVPAVAMPVSTGAHFDPSNALCVQVCSSATMESALHVATTDLTKEAWSLEAPKADQDNRQRLIEWMESASQHRNAFGSLIPMATVPMPVSH